MIGRLETVVLDTPDPRRQARFYAELLGARISTEEDRWVTIEDEDGRRVSRPMTTRSASSAIQTATRSA